MIQLKYFPQSSDLKLTKIVIMFPYFDALQLSEANWNDKREHQNETGY